MTIYVVMVQDRHTDTEPWVFDTAKAAIAAARQLAQELARRTEDYVEKPVAGWLFHARYSFEGDAVWVVAKELNAPPS